MRVPARKDRKMGGEKELCSHKLYSPLGETDFAETLLLQAFSLILEVFSPCVMPSNLMHSVLPETLLKIHLSRK